MRVLIADDEHEVRAALHILLKHQSEIEVVGEAATLPELVKQIEIRQPDRLILDWGLIAHTSGMVSSWRAEYPKLAVIVISGRSNVRQEALDAGADAFVSKSDPPERLLAALRRQRDLPFDAP
jgi:DNA-binding NarL/FixJ family response regulator